MTKVKQKVSGTFRSKEGAESFLSDTKLYEYHEKTKTICVTSDRPGYRNRNGSVELHNFIREILYLI
ncbi:hypothetical protein ACT7DZ_31610 [Bacillus cereus]